jgi:polar amino acid transport system substrate-binding protein
MRIRWTSVVAVTVAALGLAACAPTDAGSGSPTTAPAAQAPTTSAPAALDTVTAGKLTIATSEPAYEPWMVDDDPTNGKGYETAVAYAVAGKLGFAKENVVWVRQTFDQLIAPGTKNFDFAINQVSITDERKASVDFSSSYYDTAQAVVTVKGSKAATAKSLADLKGVKIGAMVGTTSLTAAEESIAPTTQVQVFNDNDQLTQALTAGLVDAIVLDLPTALYVANAQLDNGLIVGQLSNSSQGGDQFGLVLDKGSSLTPAVTAAVDALRADGTLDALQKQWLTDAAGAPVLQ